MTKRQEKWIPVASATIAICGLVVSIITARTLIEQGKQTRTHYRASVTPMVMADVSSNPLDETWGIFLKNEGIGPAVINYQGVLLDGQESTMREVVDTMIAEGALEPDRNAGFKDLENGSYLGVGERKPILEVDQDSLDTKASAKFSEFIRRRIDVRYEWCSVYEECRRGCTQERCSVPG